MKHRHEPELQWLEDALGGLIAAALQLALLPAAALFGVLVWIAKALARIVAGAGGGPRNQAARRAEDRSPP